MATPRARLRLPVSGRGPIDPDNVDRAFKRRLQFAGLPEIRFYELRHTHGSLLIAAGVYPKAMQARLGHASITTTLKTYGHLMASAFEGLGGLGRPAIGKFLANSPRKAKLEFQPIAEPRVLSALLWGTTPG